MHFDRMESYNGTDIYYHYNKFEIVKVDGEENIFKVDVSLDLKQDLDNNWMVNCCTKSVSFHLI